MKILVVAATPNELKSIKEGIKSANLKTNIDIDYLCCGIWNYESISSLEHYLSEHNQPIFIWNIWICWFWNSSNKLKLEPIQVANIINIHTEKEYVVPPFIQIATLKSCFCSECIVLEKPKFKKQISLVDDEMYFDMESWWVELVASKYKLPRVLMKIPFDLVWKETESLVGDSEDMDIIISNMCKNLPYHDYLEKIIMRIKQQNL